MNNHLPTPFSLVILLTLLTTPSHAQQSFGNAPPSSTDTGNYAQTDSGTPSFANYYFVLIGLLVILLCLGYFTLRRTRKRAYARRAAASGVPYQDTEGRYWWRSAAVTEPREEGLNERGEAPPPYIPGEHAGPSQGVELRDLGGKPPEYDGVGGGAGEGEVARPTAAHAVQGRFA
ncbi:hypothetical protein MMC30_001800 [Trapelia coarctata]|nr:hypothetical protein [Trapelia coarctata]